MKTLGNQVFVLMKLFHNVQNIRFMSKIFEIKVLPVISERNQAAAWTGFFLLLVASSLRYLVFIVPTVHGWVFMLLVKK